MCFQLTSYDKFLERVNFQLKQIFISTLILILEVKFLTFPYTVQKFLLTVVSNRHLIVRIQAALL